MPEAAPVTRASRPERDAAGDALIRGTISLSRRWLRERGEQVALHLAERSARERRDEMQILGRTERRHRLGDQCAEVGECRRFRVRHDECSHPLTPLGIGYSGDCYLGNSRVLRDERLDRLGPHVLAPRDDQVAAAAVDVQSPVG